MRWTASVVGCGLLGLPLLLSAGQASAAPYWVAWEGNDYPENEGWTRNIFGGTAATREIDGGVMRIDSLGAPQISDSYRIERLLDPEPGELFLAQWRLRVNDVQDNDPHAMDPGVALFSDDDWGLGLLYGLNSVHGSFDAALNYTFQPGLFHAYELRSSDMRNYELLIDGALAHVGAFWEPALTASRVAWGDLVQGASSSHDWDYFRFGVIPEPSAALSVLTCVGALAARTRKVRNP